MFNFIFNSCATQNEPKLYEQGFCGMRPACSGKQTGRGKTNPEEITTLVVRHETCVNGSGHLFQLLI